MDHQRFYIYAMDDFPDEVWQERLRLVVQKARPKVIRQLVHTVEEEANEETEYERKLGYKNFSIPYFLRHPVARAVVTENSSTFYRLSEDSRAA